MKKTLIFLFIGIILFCTYSHADEKPLPRFVSVEDQDADDSHGLEFILVPGGVTTVLMADPGDISHSLYRVRGPLTNELANVIRNQRNAGKYIGQHANALLHVTEIDGVKMNMLLAVGTEINKDGNEEFVLYEARFNDNGFTGVKGFFYKNGLAFTELLIESIVVYGQMTTRLFTTQTIDEVINAFMSLPESTPFENTGRGLLDSLLGIPSAFIDIFQKLFEGDPIRSLKAVVRVPFAAVQFSGMTFNKTLRAPVDGVKQIVFAIKGDPSEVRDEEDEITILRKKLGIEKEVPSHSISELKEMIIENNNDGGYEVEEVDYMFDMDSFSFEEGGKGSYLSRGVERPITWDIIPFEHIIYAQYEQSNSGYVMVASDIEIQNFIVVRFAYDETHQLTDMFYLGVVTPSFFDTDVVIKGNVFKSALPELSKKAVRSAFEQSDLEPIGTITLDDY